MAVNDAAKIKQSMAKYQTITVKVGSNVLAQKDGTLNHQRIAHLTAQIAGLHRQGIRVILVSSGAVAAGRSMVPKLPFKDTVSERQLLSSVGQVKLLNTYSLLFDQHGISCAQVLVTKEDFRTREHYLNMKNCLSVLLTHGIVPIINENDAVSVTALMFTDNDELAGLVAAMMNTDALFILTNVDGIFDKNPANPDARLITLVNGEQDNLGAYISTTKSDFGRGGMLTKCRVAQKTGASGIAVHIANGNRDNIIEQLVHDPEGVEHTRFKPSRLQPAVKKWMAHAEGFAKAEVYINDGAKSALTGPKASSLLLAGVTSMQGDFKKGDILQIKDSNHHIIGIGRAQYDKAVADRHLADEKYKPLVHYDYLFVYPETL